MWPTRRRSALEKPSAGTWLFHWLQNQGNIVAVVDKVGKTFVSLLPQKPCFYLPSKQRKTQEDSRYVSCITGLGGGNSWLMCFSHYLIDLLHPPDNRFWSNSSLMDFTIIHRNIYSDQRPNFSFLNWSRFPPQSTSCHAQEHRVGFNHPQCPTLVVGKCV